MKRLLAIMALLALTALSAATQDFSRSVTPHRDSIEVERFRSRMDSIRQHRPTVALVLSGGGAKGAAHVGAFHYLDSLKIPVDFILGTSMGGLMGGLKAMGYSTPFIDSLIRGLDWPSLMRDRIPREYISYNETKYREKYLLSMPFFYPDSNDSAANRDDDLPRRHGSFTLDAGDEDSADFFKDNLLGSLPSGYIYGQNVSNLINSLTVGCQDSIRFSGLSIPFACIATDLASGKTKIWYDGKLNTALRTTMSIPGVFTPVRMNGMILVDGGMRDNFPTALAKQLGADIVIGVDVSTPSKDYSQIRFIGDIISQSIDMWGRDVYEKNVTIPDVTIRPDITGYNALSFSKDNIDRIIHNGYVAARQQDSALAAIRERIGRDTLSVRTNCDHTIFGRDVLIRDITVLGVSGKDEKMLLDLADVKPGDRLSYERISQIVAEIYSTQCFEYVTYELHGDGEPYSLVINCRRGPTHHLGVGVRADTEEIASALLNVGLWKHRLNGSSLDISTRLSANPYLSLHYALNLPKVPTMNFETSLRWSSMKLFREKNLWSTLDYSRISADFYFSGLHWSYFDFKVGVRGDYFRDADADRFLTSVLSEKGYFTMKTNAYYLRPYVKVLADSFDDGYFPTRGWKFVGGYTWTMIHNRTQNQSLKYFHSVSADLAVAVSAPKVFTWVPRISARYLIGGSGIPLVYSNCLGGSVSGRFMDQQLPFLGVTRLHLTGDLLTMVRSDFRFNFLKHHYISGIFNGLYAAEDFRSFNAGHFDFGAALQYSYDTFFGPISVNVHWSTITHRPGFYASIGYDF